MKRELFVHFTFLVFFFVLISLFKRFIPTSVNAALMYASFWVGGIVGTLLPDIDHLIYIYLKPQELTSQRVTFMLSKREIINTFDLLAATRYERKGLIFHSVLFQVIFAVLTFWVVSSSGSLFGRGLVLAFALHLIVDQFVDFMQVGNLSTWFSQVNMGLSKEKETMYWVANLIAVLIFGFLM